VRARESESESENESDRKRQRERERQRPCFRVRTKVNSYSTQHTHRQVQRHGETVTQERRHIVIVRVNFPLLAGRKQHIACAESFCMGLRRDKRERRREKGKQERSEKTRLTERERGGEVESG
jgi:hypothetical protein